VNTLEILQRFGTECGFSAVGVIEPTGLVSQNLSWAKSAISCAFPYSNSQLNQPKPDGTGSVASFAAGPDYHIVLSTRLHLLANRIARDFPGRYSIHVDDSQISERAIALRSGIGWIGRNQCISVPVHGSYVVLGEILTDIELSTAPIVQSSLCGSCTLCIDACPSKALKNDGSFCRELCISHLTQSRGIIPSELIPIDGRSAIWL
jgi:epoxyqueuosine reductase